MTWLELFVFALAVARLARLVVADTITEPFRQYVHERWPGDHTTFADSHVDDGKTRHGADVIWHDGAWYAAEPTFIGRLVECHWCAGIWIVALGVLAYWLAPDATFVIAVPFAVAELAALIGENFDYE